MTAVNPGHVRGTLIGVALQKREGRREVLKNAEAMVGVRCVKKCSTISLFGSRQG